MTHSEIVKILNNNAQKSVIGWAVEEDDFEEVALQIQVLSQTKWISIAERLPEAGQLVIVTRASSQSTPMKILTYKSGYGADWGYTMADFFASPTHWMPVPEMPKPKKNSRINK